ncbi:MAG: TIGR03643 family protein [Pelagibacterales bacterium]|nr:TIGR03643 family protein [Alphaproteobacteria bacterium]MBL6862195.1 TIGR03643 family protein [Pelagibacterales bacterium]
MKKLSQSKLLSQKDVDRIIEMCWEDRTTFSDIKLQFNLLEKEVIAIMKANLKRKSFLNWRKRVRGRKTKIQDLSDRFHSKKQKIKNSHNFNY